MPVQQDEFEVQERPFGLHAHCPFVHKPEQQSPFEEQDSVEFLQVAHKPPEHLNPVQHVSSDEHIPPPKRQETHVLVVRLHAPEQQFEF